MASWEAPYTSRLIEPVTNLTDELTVAGSAGTAELPPQPAVIPTVSKPSPRVNFMAYPDCHFTEHYLAIPVEQL